MDYDISLDELFARDPYSLDAGEKEKMFFPILAALTERHMANCAEYAAIVKKTHNKPVIKDIESLPLFPVRLFKEYELRSVKDADISRAVTSSGTTGQRVSKVFLDKETSFAQVKALAKIVTSFIGSRRLPLLLLDTEAVRTDPRLFAVRGAGLMSFLTFGKDAAYILDKNMNINWTALDAFLNKHNDEPILMTGYTFVIWEYVAKALEKAGKNLNIKKGFLFHGGGWKKLADKAVSREEFSRRINGAMGNIDVRNYYGMAEQLGSIFVECEYGHMHCSIFSDAIARRPGDFSSANFNERGLLQLFSVLPKSYPGHALLTEDEGEILGEDDCPCGRKGKYFKIHGRVKNAEVRGCSDTYEKRS